MLALLAVVTALPARAAPAANVDVIVDSAKPKFVAAGEGTQTVKIALANVSGSPVTVGASIADDGGCTLTPKPTSLKPGRLTTVTFTADGCEVEHGADVTLRFAPRVAPRAYTVGVSPPTASEKPQWSILQLSFLLSLGVAGGVAGYLLAKMRRHNPKYKSKRKTDPPQHQPKGAEGEAGQLAAGVYRYAVTFFDGHTETALGTPSADVLLDGGHQVALSEIPLREGARTRIYRSLDGGNFYRVGEMTAENGAAGKARGTYSDNLLVFEPKTPLESFGTDWSFSDNWISTATVGSTLLVALLGTSSVLKAILGEEPEAALALLAVAGAVAALLVGISPLFVKVIGKDLSHPTISGTLLAAVVTLAGSIGLILTVTWQGWDIVPWGPVRVAIALLGVAIAATVVFYAIRTLWYDIETGTASPAAKEADVLTAADHIVLAITGTDKEKDKLREQIEAKAMLQRAMEEAIETGAIPRAFAESTPLRVAQRNTMI